MTPTPPSGTTSSNGLQSPVDEQYRVVRKRNRVPLSCAPCRNRKLKCNRSSPCENCVKRGDAMSCSYAAPGSRKKQNISHTAGSTPNDMQDRIDRLENLVLSLMTNGSQSAGPAAAARALSASNSSASMEYSQDTNGNYEDEPMTSAVPPEGESETEEMAKSLGVMKVDGNKSITFFGEVHWASVLSDLADLKTWFSEHKKQYDDQCEKVQESKNNEDFTRGPTFLFGAGKLPEVVELLASVPPRSVADQLVARYFNSYDPAIHILHPPSWYRLYEAHWEDPSKTSPAWLGQLFAIMCLAMYSYHRGGDEPPDFRGRSRDLASNYRMLTAQCLLVADFTKPVNHMIEALILHLHSEYARSRDAEVGVWVLVGMIVRLAMRMGYHRDPKYYSNISPFQGEIRRRVWTFVRQSDLLYSFQIGLPSMIRLGDCDTELPRNLYDREFDENTKVLPTARPSAEPTPVSYMIAKAKMAFAFGKVIESAHSLATCSYDDVMALDTLLRETRGDLSPHLRFQSVEESPLEPGALIMQRYNLDILYNKGQCVLHRKFLGRARENNRYSHSRRACVDASMDLLHYQATLHYESQPGRRLHGMEIFISSLVSHDCLLAAMIICLDLHYSLQSESSGRGSGDMYTWGLERRSEMIRALEVSRDIWREEKDQSMEAYKACEILTFMVDKLKAKRFYPTMDAGGNPYPTPSPAIPERTPYMHDDERPEQAAAMTLGMLSNGRVASNSVPQFSGNYPNIPNSNLNPNSQEMQQSAGMAPYFSTEQSSNTLNPIPSPMPLMTNTASMFELPANWDWDAWDSYIQSTGRSEPGKQWPANMELLLTPGAEGQEQQGVFGNGAGGGNAIANGGLFVIGENGGM